MPPRKFKGFPSPAAIEDIHARNAVTSLSNMIRTEADLARRNKASIFGDTPKLIRDMEEMVDEKIAAIEFPGPKWEDIEISGMDGIYTVDDSTADRKRFHIRKESDGETEGGDTYTGYFAPSDTSETDEETEVTTLKVTIAAGKVVVGGTVINTAAIELTVTATAYIFVQVTYSGGYLASIAQAASYPSPVAGTWKRVICVVTVADGQITSIDRQVAGPVHYEG
jgi:hypothetical protein